MVKFDERRKIGINSKMIEINMYIVLKYFVYVEII
jgi:hypothetical protein